MEIAEIAVWVNFLNGRSRTGKMYKVKLSFRQVQTVQYLFNNSLNEKL